MRDMKYFDKRIKKADRRFVLFYSTAIIIWLIMISVIVGVAYHFISKYW